MLNRFNAFINEQHLFSDREEVLLAVSGGKDSVTLCDLMHRSQYRFAIAHCNFNLREGDCDRDEHFVRNLAKGCNVPVHVVSFDTVAEAAANGESIEEAARRLRYSYFKDLCRQFGYSCVATAHHRDDSTETFFINLLRGTGITGLHGILPKMNNVVRPMLCFSRKEIDEYVQSNGLHWVEDCTNATLEYTRNRVRHQLMPLLRQLSPNIDNIMESNIANLVEAEEIYHKYVDNACSNLLHQLPDGGYYIEIRDIDVLSPRKTILYELICKPPFCFSKSTLTALLDVLHGESGKQFYSASYRMLKDRTRVFIYPLNSGHNQMPEISVDVVDRISVGTLKCTATKALFDAEKVAQPISLRRWKPGDRFVPFGMKGSRLVSDFLKDKHLSLIEKEKVWVLTDAEDRILWIVGMRADGRCAVSDNTTSILSVSVVSPQ